MGWSRLKVVELKLVDEDNNIEYLRKTIVDNKVSINKRFDKNNRGESVSLLSERVRYLIDEEELEGLCLFRFYENITISDLDAKEVSIGQRFQIGETVQEVVSIGERCFKECKLIQSGEECDFFMNIVFTKVIKSGYVKIDDEVRFLDK